MRGASVFDHPHERRVVEQQDVGVGAVEQREQLAPLAGAARGGEAGLPAQQGLQPGSNGGVAVMYGDANHRSPSLRRAEPPMTSVPARR